MFDEKTSSRIYGQDLEGISESIRQYDFHLIRFGKYEMFSSVH